MGRSSRDSLFGPRRLPHPFSSRFTAGVELEISTPYTYPLSKDCTGIVRFRGQSTVADVERLIDFLTLSKSAFPIAVGPALAREGKADE